MDVFLDSLHYHVNVKSTVVYRKKSTVTYISCVLKMFLISKSFIRYPFRCSLVTASFCIHSAPAARVTASSTDPRASPWTTSTTSWWRTGGTPGCRCTVTSSASKSSIRRFVITEKAFSWLKVATTAFTFKTLLRHYAKRALTPLSLNVKLGPRRNYHKGRAAIRHYANQTARPL